MTLTDGRVVLAYVPINNPKSDTYLGKLDLSERVHSVHLARGSDGGCIQYVLGVRDSLEEAGISDPHVDEFIRALDEGS